MEDKPLRSPGGKLALWLFYGWCGYFIWAMVRYFWVVSAIQVTPGVTLDGDMGTLSGKLMGALAGSLVFVVVGSILAGIAWYTRPRDAGTDRRF